MEKMPKKNYQLPPLVSQTHPWLLIIHGKRLQRQTFFSVSEGKYYTRVIPELSFKNILFSSTKGCLLLKDRGSSDLSLLNLHNMETIQLPKLEFDYDYVLWQNLHDSNFRIWFCDCDCDWDSHYLMLYQPGNHQYIKKEVQFVVEWGDPRDDIFSHMGMFSFMGVRNVIALENKIYTVLKPPRCHLMVGDLDDSVIQFRQLTKKPLPHPRTVIAEHYLIESHLGILLVRENYSHSGFFNEVVDYEVFALNHSTHEWMEIQDIGDRAIFIQNRQAICYDLVDSRVKKNSIYFFQYFARHLYVFDIEEKSISKSSPCPNVSNKRFRVRWVSL